MVIKTLERVSKNYYYIIRGELNKEMSEKQYVNGGIIYGQEKRI